MKPLALMLFVVLMSLPTVAFAQSDAQYASVDPVPSAAQESFATLKNLAGEWEGVITVREMPELKVRVHVSLRVTSRTTIRSRCCTSTRTQTGLRWFTIATRGTGLA
jgi:hypothetical protein